MKTKSIYFYIESIKNFEEYNIISHYLGELGDTMNRVSKTQVVGDRLEFVKKFPKCTQTLDRVYIHPISSDLNLSISDLISSGAREQGLWKKLINSSTESYRYSRVYLYIEEITLKKELLDLAIELSRLINKIKVENIINKIIDYEVEFFNKVWPFSYFGKNGILLNGIGSRDCYKFWVDEEDLKNNFPLIYNRIVYTYMTILPLLVSMFRKLLVLIEENEKST